MRQYDTSELKTNKHWLGSLVSSEEPQNEQVMKFVAHLSLVFCQTTPDLIYGLSSSLSWSWKGQIEPTNWKWQ